MITWTRIATISVALASFNILENTNIELRGINTGAALGEKSILNSGAYVAHDYCHQQDRALTLASKDYIDDVAKAFGTSATYITAPAILPHEDGISLQLQEFPVAVADIALPDFEPGSLNPDILNGVFDRSLEHSLKTMQIAIETVEHSGCAMALSSQFQTSMLEPLQALVIGTLSEIFQNPDKHPDFPEWELDQLRELEPLMRQMGTPLAPGTSL